VGVAVAVGLGEPEGLGLPLGEGLGLGEPEGLGLGLGLGEAGAPLAGGVEPGVALAWCPMTPIWYSTPTVPPMALIMAAMPVMTWAVLWPRAPRAERRRGEGGPGACIGGGQESMSVSSGLARSRLPSPGWRGGRRRG
jgi:hypothetical protein